MTKLFKAGDKVYCPRIGGNIYTLRQNNSMNSAPLTLQHLDFKANGCLFGKSKVPQVFHATEQNRILLGKLHGVEFEELPAKPTSLKIIQHLLTKQKFVLCRVYSSKQDVQINNYSYDLIQAVHPEESYRYEGDDGVWMFAVPIDLATGKPITEINQ